MQNEDIYVALLNEGTNPPTITPMTIRKSDINDPSTREAFDPRIFDLIKLRDELNKAFRPGRGNNDINLSFQIMAGDEVFES